MKLRSLGMIAFVGVLASMCLSSAKAEALLASVKTVGRALTQTAYPEDSFCVCMNPAGGAFIGNRYDAGIHFEHRRQSATVRGNQARAPVQIPGDGVVLVPVPEVNGTFPADKTKTQYLPDVGINYEFGCDNEYTFGFASYNRAFLKTSYNTSFPLFGTSNLGLEYLNHELDFYATYKFNKCHAIGISFDWHIARLKINGLERVANPPFGGPFTLFPDHFTNNGYNYRPGYGFRVGYLGKIRDDISIGIAVTPQTWFGKYQKYKGFVVQGKLDGPWRFATGIAWRFLPNATIAFDYEYEAFNRIPTLRNKQNRPDAFDPLLGSKGATGFGWRGRNFYRVGIDYTFNDQCDPCGGLLSGLTIRGGFRYANPLFKRNQTVINALSCETPTTGATCGFTKEFGCGSEVSMYYIHLFKRTVRGKNSFTPALGGGEADLRQRQNLWGIAYGKSW